jgi:hypothetical protein
MYDFISTLNFTDEEVMTIYLFEIIDKKREIKTIYDYSK